MQRFAVRFNRTAASILALAHEVFSVRGTLRRYRWINGSASRYKSSPQLELDTPTAVSIPIVLDSSLIRDASTSNAFSKLSRCETKIERSLYKALYELQRLQAARGAGGNVSPRVAVDVDVSGVSREGF